MADKSWKKWERDVAVALGGTRTGPRGFGLPDVRGIPHLAPECKYQKTLSFKEGDWDQARENASRVGLRPALFLKERGGKRMRVVMDFDDFVWLWRSFVH